MNSASLIVWICGLLGAALCALKFLDIHPVGNWSWWWVSAPLWVPVLLVLALWAVFIVWGLRQG